MNDSVLGAVSQLKANGTSIAGIVLELVDSEFSFLEIGKIFGMLGHFVALGPGSTELRGEMLIGDEPGSPVVNSTATSISWGQGATREDELPLRNHPEEILVKELLKKGVPIQEVMGKLVGVGLTASELRDLFKRLEHKIYGGGFEESEGWMLIFNNQGGIGGTDFARVYWGDDDHREGQETPVVTWE